MTMLSAVLRTEEDRKPATQLPSEADLESLYKKVGITAVFAAANYVKPAKSRRAV